MKLMLIASSGGHIYELFCMREFWQDKERSWVTFKTADSQYLLKDEKEVYWASHPTVRNIPNLIRNLRLAARLLRTRRPDLILSTGAGVAVPFIWLARLLGIRSVYVESVTRINELSMTARLIRPFVDKMLVQWPELADKYPDVEYHGRIA